MQSGLLHALHRPVEFQNYYIFSLCRPQGPGYPSSKGKRRESPDCAVSRAQDTHQVKVKGGSHVTMDNTLNQGNSSTNILPGEECKH